MRHDLKTHPEPFAAVVAGRKTYEIRVADRPFAVGDTLRLAEWNPAVGAYTGRWTEFEVAYLTPGGTWGLPPDLCVMAIRKPGSACGVDADD